jgi:hypothetical protein
MRAMLSGLVVLLAMTGCAIGPGDGLDGRQKKNGGVVRYERLGASTGQEIPGEWRCGAKQVKWCSGDADRCGCVDDHIAQDRVRRMTRQLSNRRMSEQSRRRLFPHL